MRAVTTSTPTSLLGDRSHHGYQTPHHCVHHEYSARAASLAPLQHRVDHTYRDFANFPAEELPTRKKTPTNFPSKLHQILSNPEYAHIISWMPHGRAWKIHNKELLIRDVVPNYFVHSKYESFTRQIVGWGFKRLHQAGHDFNAFYHECFLRGLPHLTVLIKRVAPNQGKLLPHVEGEPNFYDINVQYPLPSPNPIKDHHHSSVGDDSLIPEHNPSKRLCRKSASNHVVRDSSATMLNESTQNFQAV